MHRIVATAALFVALFVPVRAAEAPTVLYDHAPWTVARFDVPGGPVCFAAVGGLEKSFTIFGTKEASAITVMMSDWDFEEHEGSLLLRVDDSGMGVDNAIYSGNAARIVSAKEMIYVIMLGLDVPGDGNLEVLGGEDNKVIATFDITGVGAALKAWKDCVDAL